jgi:Copper type II ascorbate-dependent monooxygenase, C-terminal domain
MGSRFAVAAYFAVLLAGVVGCSAASAPKRTTASSSTNSGANTSTSSKTPGYYQLDGQSLPTPADGTGFQIETPDYDANDPNAKNLIVNPGQEIFLCYHVTLPNADQVDIGGFQSWMSPGSSHHFIVYQLGGNGAAGGFPGGFGGNPQPSGTISSCGFAGGTWVYATSTPGTVVGMNLPDNVGLPMAASQSIVLNMHFINAGADVLYPKVKLNILLATNVQYHSSPMISFNPSINVPPAAADGTPGTQTVRGTCTVPTGSQFYSMSTHTHKHATAAVIQYVSADGTAQEIVHTGAASSYPPMQAPNTGADWEHPGVSAWNAPNFLTVQMGDSFSYSCTYENKGAAPVTVGETAASNEMCMAVGYFFPAGTSRCN